MQTKDVKNYNSFFILSNFKNHRPPLLKLEAHIDCVCSLIRVAQGKVENEGFLILCCSFQLFLQSLSAPDPVKSILSFVIAYCFQNVALLTWE